MILMATRIRSVERDICPIASICTVLLSWSRDPGHANVSETFSRVTSRLSLEHACQICWFDVVPQEVTWPITV